MIVVGVDDAGHRDAITSISWPDSATAQVDASYGPGREEYRRPDRQVMPSMDKTYRSLTIAHTGIGGTSYGGVISC